MMLRIKKFLPPVLLAVLLFLLCSQFSYYSDDWFWGTDGSLSTFFDSFSNPDNPFHFYNNGRYLGNGLGFLAANHRLFRNLLMTAVLWEIITCITKISLLTAGTVSAALKNLMLAVSASLLLLCPKEMFRESIVCGEYSDSEAQRLLNGNGSCVGFEPNFPLIRIKRNRTLIFY